MLTISQLPDHELDFCARNGLTCALIWLIRILQKCQRTAHVRVVVRIRVYTLTDQETNWVKKSFIFFLGYRFKSFFIRLKYRSRKYGDNMQNTQIKFGELQLLFPKNKYPRTRNYFQADN